MIIRRFSSAGRSMVIDNFNVRRTFERKEIVSLRDTIFGVVGALSHWCGIDVLAAAVVERRRH